MTNKKYSIGTPPTTEPNKEEQGEVSKVPEARPPMEDWEKDMRTEFGLDNALKQSVQDLPPELVQAMQPGAIQTPINKEVVKDISKVVHDEYIPPSKEAAAVGTSTLNTNQLVAPGLLLKARQESVLHYVKDKLDLKVEDISDGYHTFKELYEFRVYLTAMWFYNIYWIYQMQGSTIPVWRSKLHSDGTMYEGGWFIVGFGFKEGHQITFHYEEKFWDVFSFCRTLDRAPEWDGHTSQDVLKRIKKMIP